jgi:hypothetical protein
MYVRRHLRSAHTTTRVSIRLLTARARSAVARRPGILWVQEVACRHKNHTPAKSFR